MRSAPDILLIPVLVLLLGSGWAHAQDKPPAPKPSPVAGIIRNFEFPDRDEKGRLRFIIKGEQAKPLGPDQFELTNLKATFFSADGKEEAVFITRFCIFNQKTREIQTEEEIELQRPNMIIRGKGMEGNLTKDGDGISIKQNVTVEVEDLMKGVVVVPIEE
ncbi:MAG: LPS export ABC transporter periplasmic protein LptC [Verrucomicrobiae bacterium]|nr:LPS export ABC transporter periplasmic protein LptC [Verrucomicrobiae bacterium]